ncbi:MAG: hypothetical protein JOZ55_07455 [Alphaproteobacteria bacterium]|nr:hypothetical protein [Alphaproteobacteria bacterium]
MIYLLAIFCSPLALLFAGKPVSFLFNLLLYVLAIAFWLTLIFWHFGFFLWAIALLHAILAIHDVRADRRARHVIARMRRE